MSSTDAMTTVDATIPEAPERLRRAEAVIQHRTSRLVLVLEQCMDSHNHQAVLRTAEALGIQHVWLVNPNERQVKKHKSGSSTGNKKIAKNCSFWLTMREFTSISDCIDALKAENCTIWATDLSPEAVPLSSEHKPSELPSRLAIVIGRETDGVSAEMLSAADKRVYFPIFGFTESLNLSVATALVVQRLFDWFPEIRGDLSSTEKEQIRTQWYPQLIHNPTQARQAAHWVEHSHEIPPLDDLRREKLQYNESWIPKRVRQREMQMPEVQERIGVKPTANHTPDNATEPRTADEKA
ncbi:hypothetical protein Poli38472_012173 [Pythium oligandrum]|uniref:tRNA/rRNA methyltransferase SpoU type domain-containing protein n=1 Tax=Pythium oligandrum TaxID=41045 RepID=A0A8K1CNY8_PYTOL|nr:hypothetical protein Poli38472_012173 [Pythium oligandrum]|eukprot:TMW67057.1 hypothetical protein Poli38472_012173 [Pythium oligandrum]